MLNPAVNAYAAQLLDRIANAEALVGIIGLGYVGLPLARTFSGGGFRVLGLMSIPVKLRSSARGESYIGHIPQQVVRQMKERRFDATDSFERLTEPDAIVICVPTPLTSARTPDLTYIVNSAKAVAATLRPGQLVVLESTTYPSTTRNVVLPILEPPSQQPGGQGTISFSPSAPSVRIRATQRIRSGRPFPR